MVMFLCVAIGCCVCLFMPFAGSMLVVGGILVIMSLLSSAVMAATSGSWFSFITFLIYVTGLLVLFGYLLVVSPNSAVGEVSSFGGVKLVLAVLPVFVFFMAQPTFEFKSYSNGLSLKVLSIYDNPNMPIYLFVVCLMFVVLVLVVYVSYKTPKPMRYFLR